MTRLMSCGQKSNSWKLNLGCSKITNLADDFPNAPYVPRACPLKILPELAETKSWLWCVGGNAEEQPDISMRMMTLSFRTHSLHFRMGQPTLWCLLHCQRWKIISGRYGFDSSSVKYYSCSNVTHRGTWMVWDEIWRSRVYLTHWGFWPSILA